MVPDFGRDDVWMPPYQARGRLLKPGMTERDIYKQTLNNNDPDSLILLARPKISEKTYTLKRNKNQVVRITLSRQRPNDIYEMKNSFRNLSGLPDTSHACLPVGRDTVTILMWRNKDALFSIFASHHERGPF
jgi:hypothetical protein